MYQRLRRAFAYAGILALPLLLAACGSSDQPAASNDLATGAANVAVGSEAIAANALIPKEYTCEGANSSPPLHWTGTPAGARAQVVILDDPDAPGGTFYHWLVYDIPVSVAELPAGVPKDEVLANGAKQGKNDFGKPGYGGPCPPTGSEHHYRFRVFALDTPLNLDSGRSAADVTKAMKGHILAFGELVARFSR